MNKSETTSDKKTDKPDLNTTTGRVQMNQKDYAKHRGLTHMRINQMVREGKLDAALIDTGKKRQGKPILKIDVSIADAILDENVPLKDAKTKKEHYQALTAELEYRYKIGELIEVSQVEKEAYEMAKTIRDKLLLIPDRIAAQLASEKDETKCFKMLSDELTKALEALSE
jgi:hypothetical protein